MPKSDTEKMQTQMREYVDEVMYGIEEPSDYETVSDEVKSAIDDLRDTDLQAYLMANVPAIEEYVAMCMEDTEEQAEAHIRDFVKDLEADSSVQEMYGEIEDDLIANEELGGLWVRWIRSNEKKVMDIIRKTKENPSGSSVDDNAAEQLVSAHSEKTVQDADNKDAEHVQKIDGTSCNQRGKKPKLTAKYRRQQLATVPRLKNLIKGTLREFSSKQALYANTFLQNLKEKGRAMNPPITEQQIEDVKDVILAEARKKRSEAGISKGRK